MFNRIPRRSTPEQPQSPQTQEDAIASFRARREAAVIEHKKRSEAVLAELPPDVAADKRRFIAGMSEILAEKDAAARRNPSTQSRPYGYLHPSWSNGSGLRSRGLAATALPLVASGLAWGIGVGITQANYSSEDASEYLEQQGYTEISEPDTNIMFIGFQGCGNDDLVQYEFETTAPNGANVEMMVCVGLFKAATTRQG